MALETYTGELGQRKFISRSALTPGMVIQFTYDGEQKYAIVLDPNWKDKLHGLSLKDFEAANLTDMSKMIGDLTDGTKIYEKFKNSVYVADRPYRTYLLSKITSLRQVNLKPQIPKASTKKTPTENMYGETG